MLRRIQRLSTLALILSPVGVLLLAATRVLIVADYNVTTALAILSSSGYINTLVGSVIPLVPILMPYVGLALLYLNRVPAALLISPATLSGASALSLVKHDWGLMTGGSGLRQAVLIILAIALSGLLLIEIAGFQVATVIRTIGTVGIIASLPLIVRLYPVPVSNSFYTNVLSQPWLPAETITLTTHQAVTGYVLESDQDWFEVLLAQDRTVVHYHTSDVASRALCQTASTESKRPLVPLVPAVSQIPACPQPPSPGGAPVPAVSGPGTRIFGVPAVRIPPGLPPKESGQASAGGGR